MQALSVEDIGVRIGFTVAGRTCKERHKLKHLRKHQPHYLKQCWRTVIALMNLCYQTGIGHSLMSYLSKFNRRQRLTSRVGGVGYLGNEASRWSCSPHSSGPELGGCTAGRLKGDGAVGSTAGAWRRPSSDKGYLYCRVLSVGSNSSMCKHMTLQSFTIQLHLSWTEANSHNILFIFS